MDRMDIYRSLVKKNDSKMVLFVMDGLGDIHDRQKGGTSLEVAKTPTLDGLAKESSLGLLEPIGAGLTPGSGPAHLALFGYDPLTTTIGRGVLAALGIGFKLTERDVAARLNFCTVDNEGKVIDRRAGRIPTDENKRIVEKLRKGINLGCEAHLETVSEHRALLVLREDGLSGRIHDTDPQITGVPALEPVGAPEAAKTIEYVKRFLSQAREILKDEPKANMVLARGFAAYVPIPSMAENFGVKAGGIASYPMYRGVADYSGMTLLENPSTLEDQVEILKKYWKDYDFFFFHVKYTDKAGEDGDFDKKVSVIEEVDREILPKVLELGPDVLAVTGDHSTPAAMKSHSWHPVPVLLKSDFVRLDKAERFNETTCRCGALGLRPMKELLPLMVANAGRFEKFGA